MDVSMKGVANEVVDLDGEIAKIFTCPVCLNFFRTPKLLPNCGHSLCLDCVKQLLPNQGTQNGPTKLTCPECRSESDVNLKDIEKEMKTNFPVQRAVELLKTEEGGEIFRIGENCPHVDKFCKISHKCPHCEQDFCNVCLVSHLERVKVETKWIGSRLAERVEVISGSAESKFNSLKEFIEDQVKTAQEQIQGETERLLASVKENCERLMAEAQRLGEEQLAKAGQLLEFTSSAKGRVCSVQENLAKLNELSPLFNSSAEFAAVYSKVCQHDEELFALEELEAIMKSSKMELKLLDENTKGELLDSLTKFFGLSLKIEEPPKLEGSSERLRLIQAIQSNNVDVLRRRYSSLPPVVCSFVTEHSSPYTPLMLAAESGALEVAKFLVEEQKANVLCCDDGAEGTLLHLAAKNGHVNVVEYLTQSNPSLIYATNNEKNSPLNLAAEDGRDEVVKFLIKQKNINVENNGYGDLKWTPLHQAAANGHLKVVETLVEIAGANMLATDEGGDLPIHLAALNGHCDVVKVFVNKQKDLTTFKNSESNAPIHTACIYGRCDVVNCLLDLDPDLINLRGRFRRTPLQAAAANGKLEVVKLLVKRGANVFEASSGERGTLAIHIAAYYGHTNVVEFFATHDAKLVNVRPNQSTTGETPLATALRNKQFDVASVLVKKFKATQ